jgi:isoquinoline 1-oxidoreductase
VPILAGIAFYQFGKTSAALAARLKVRERSERHLLKLSRQDRLTGLPNRRALEREIEPFVAVRAQGRFRPALLLLDLDKFKHVNDTLGHDAGDELLKLFAERLRDTMGPLVSLYRLGGDEFVITLAGSPADSDVERLCRVIKARADEPFELIEGDVERGLHEATAVLAETYHAAYAAHFPLESRAAVAEWNGERVTVWTATQSPFGARAELAEELGVAEDRVRVIVPPLGGAFGGKHGAGAGVAAARLARATGRPVRVRWRHSDEFVWGHVRPAAVIDVRAGARNGSITAWDVLNMNAGESAIEPPYRIANRSLRFRPADSPLPQSSYRALAATVNTFARESAVDELAVAVGADPLEFRLANVADERLAVVLRTAAEHAGWDHRARPAGKGHGLGIAGSVEKDARVATCAEVIVRADGRLKIIRIVTAFDCGTIVDAENLTNQIEGSTVMAIGPALFEAVEFDHGRVTNSSFSAYRVPRFRDVPTIKAVLIDQSGVTSAGAGETPLIAVAPALANAIFDASGVRLRAMPLVPTGIVTAAGPS